MSVWRFSAAEQADSPSRCRCRRLGVSPAGDYAWLHRQPSARAPADAAVSRTIRPLHRASRGTDGVLRIHAEPAEAHRIHCGRERVAGSMRLAGLRGVWRRQHARTTQRDQTAEVADELVPRAVRAAAPARLWVADITCLPTWQGFRSLAVIIEACSRRVVGWSLADHLRTELVRDASGMALGNRRPGPGRMQPSDPGCQATGPAFGRRLRQAERVPSMGSVGDCSDNALAESFFATREWEVMARTRWPTHTQARLASFDSIEAFYTPRRRHSARGYLSPAEYERTARLRSIAA